MAVVLLDTNILLATANPNRTDHNGAVDSVQRLAQNGAAFVVTAQILREFFVVATRPIHSNGWNLSPKQALQAMRIILEGVDVVPESNRALARWYELVEVNAVSGTKAHDAFIVACMLENEVYTILTSNRSDFDSFSEIKVIVPGLVV